MPRASRKLKTMINYDAPWTNYQWVSLSRRLLDSYESWLEQPLVSRTGTSAEQAERLFRAPFVVLAHDSQTDPIFCYANKRSLELWEISLQEILAMPSRLTADPQQQANRTAMLQQGLADGYLTGYEGIRVSSTGKRFFVRNATIFNVLNDSGGRIGQAATFADWEFLP